LPTESKSLIEVVMPQLGISMTEGTILKWHAAPGAEVAYEQTICDIATDKIESEIPAPASGRLVEIICQAGETVDAGTAIAIIESSEAPRASAATATAASPSPGAAEALRKANRDRAPGEPVYSPVVLRLAVQHHIDLTQIQGTGRDGRIRKQDVMAVIEAAGPTAAAPLEPYVPPPPTPLSPMRQAIGEHMKRSMDVAATVTSWIEVDFSAIERARREAGLTALPVVASATIATLAEYPDLNAWLEGERFVRHDAVNLGIAVALADEGLIVPVIRDAQDLTIADLSARIRDLAGRGRRGRLLPDEVRDGTFTITNPGQFGTMMATPVLNQPQVAILDIEAIVRRPVVVTAADGSEEIAIRPICILGMSWDHRALDGALAARFLGALRKRLENWE
jgi:pyruvate/2-oxoglutarate dehydrogenase complex dihydrolipoamide acyltransferase (E2) component